MEIQMNCAKQPIDKIIDKNLKPLKYAGTALILATNCVIGVMNQDPNTLSYAFMVASFAYTGITGIQASVSCDKEGTKMLSGQITSDERTPIIGLAMRHFIEPVTDAVKITKQLLGPSKP